MTIQVRMICQRVISFASRERWLIGASIFRILTGLIILYQYLINYHQRYYLYGPDAVWPYATFLEEVAKARSFSLYAFSPAPLFFELVFHLGILVTVLWVMGWHTRLMTLLTYIFVWSLHERNPLLWDGGDNVVQIILVSAVFANLGAHFSLDADRLRAARARGGLRASVQVILHNAALLSFALQLCLVYGVAGLYKVQGRMWQSGTALYYIMRVDEFTWPGYSEYVYQNVFLVTALSYATVAFQVSFPFLFFLNRYTRRLILLAGLSFHLGIALFMGLITFSAFLISIEFALLSDGDYQKIGRWFTHRRACLAHWVAQKRRALRESPVLAPLARPPLLRWLVPLLPRKYCHPSAARPVGAAGANLLPSVRCALSLWAGHCADRGAPPGPRGQCHHHSRGD
jgi:hypothetical protein